MANENVTFSKGTSQELPEEILGGRFLVETDTGDMYLDVDDTTRIKILGLPSVTSVDNDKSLIVQNGAWVTKM